MGFFFEIVHLCFLGNKCFVLFFFFKKKEREGGSGRELAAIVSLARYFDAIRHTYDVPSVPSKVGQHRRRSVCAAPREVEHNYWKGSACVLQDLQNTSITRNAHYKEICTCPGTQISSISLKLTVFVVGVTYSGRGL